MKKRAPHPDDPEAHLYSVTQVADMLGTSAAVLRRWDREGLASPGRSSGGQRRYSRAQIGQLERAMELAGGGLSTSAIQQMMVIQDRVAELEGELEREKAKYAKEKAKNRERGQSR